jgi:hypothetical protein
MQWFKRRSPATDGDLLAAVGVLQQFTDEVYADVSAQVGYQVDRRDYRRLWMANGGRLRWPLFTLRSGLHPYGQVVEAVTVVGTQARRSVRVTDPDLVLSHVFEVLDLILVGWEFARVRVDVDAATLFDRLVAAARDVRSAMPDPPPLPDPVRELMRRRLNLEVLDPVANRIVGTIDPGRQMRESFLI